MSKRTLGLIILLIIIVGGLFAIALSPQKPNPLKMFNAPAPTPVAQTVLSLSPNPLVISSNSGTLDVNVNTNGNNITGVQLELSYDPQIITITDVTPSTFFESSFPLFKNITPGKLFYALAISPSGTPKVGLGTVAKISFQMQTGVAKTTEITVLPKTLVTASGIEPSVLKQAIGTTIVFENSATSNQ